MTARPRSRHRTLLVVDDEELFARVLSDDLSGDGLTVVTAATGAEALETVRRSQVDVILLDQKLPDAHGPELCPAFLQANERTKIIFITAYPDFGNAREAIRAGAVDYLSKPCELEEVRYAVERCLKTLELERRETITAYRNRVSAEECSVIGNGPSFSRIRELVELAAPTDSPVLITGETGTGKSLIARAIHHAGSRGGEELVSINCAALPEGLIESELFGWEQGAFTGATGSREGLFEMAEGGTLFLDEIGEMPITLQSRLLNVLDDGTIRRVGGRSFRRVDFRLIAATNADLEACVEEKRFRQDLFYRLNVLRIHLPSLRERPEDLLGLTHHFMRQLGGSDLTLAPGEEARLADYPWPGNLRELRNVVERACLLRRESQLRPSDFLESRGRPSAAPAPQADELPTLEELEQQHMRRALARTGGNVTRAARILGVSVSTLRRKRPHSRSAVSD